MRGVSEEVYVARRVFICYRVADAEQAASRLKEALDARLLGEIFLAYRTIRAGEAWPDRLRQSVAAADIVLMLVGEKWLKLQTDDGIRRLDEPDDWVRLEIETALAANCLIVPVLVDGADQLARRNFRTIPQIASIADFQALPLATREWSHHVDALVERLVIAGFARKPIAVEPPPSPVQVRTGTTPNIAASDIAAPDAAAADTVAYLRAAESQHASLHFAGFKTRLRVPVDLGELHVPLSAVLDLRGAGDARFGDAKQARDTLDEAGGAHEIALTEAFREAQRRTRRGIVVLGDPGSGKTTHLKRLLLWCVRRQPAGLGLPDDIVPVFLPLRELRDLSHGLDAFIEAQLESPHLGLSPGIGKRLLDRGRLLFLLDGLDEVADAGQRAKVARWIESAARARHDCVFAVTSRFAGYGDARLNEDFLELHIRPLTAEQSSAFIHNWYRAVETGLGGDQSQAEALARTRADELIARLGDGDFRSTRLTWMTSNPLLLANLCLVHRDRGQLPRGRARLYEECVEVLLERWREGKGLAVDVRAEEGRRVLQPVADWLHSKEQRTRATAAELDPVVEPALKAVQWKGGGSREFLRTVRDESGLLTGWGVDEYGFMHLGFQEYLAAREIRRRHFTGDARALPDLAARFGQAWWQEVILLLVSLKEEPSVFEPFMREVAKLPVFVEHERLLDDCREDAFDVSETPFVELVLTPPGLDASLWARQLVALRQLERMRSSALYELRASLGAHPWPAIRRWLAEQARAAAQDAVVTDPGGVELLLIPGGTCVMGSPNNEEGRWDDEGPQHSVTVGSFYVGRYPVTNEEYARFLEANPKAQKPSEWGNRTLNGARQPVVGVSWDEARQFAAWASCRLPSEAEWEYAARAGTTAPYLGGASQQDLARHAWYDENSKNQTHPVGEKAVNAFGLHDVLGNTREWVEDDWHANYEGAPTDGSAWVGKARAADRVLRGGSWLSSARICRVASRYWWPTGERIRGLGFRVARSLPFTL